ncbi:glycosyltransferase family 1 protein [Taibaiella lutea]|uniref:Glycosyltransferase family 1 protein n=1 Tax=Taibaiella lutea TaxID=2608001 RepID=A0A5M6CLQ8_9BACT|nr:glycosyltransferase family 1 protein [Taibaiella lutea]KAA5536158.1 glycosyltransferase family 1 protein [Taibaiella lutea]
MDLICFSHLRWDFVFQRPQHLLSRSAKTFRTFYIEEPVFSLNGSGLHVNEVSRDLYTITPFLPEGLQETEMIQQQHTLLAGFWMEYNIQDYIAWFYTPMALPIMEGLPQPVTVVYDCMDELSGFKFAPPEMHQREQQLIERADIVFTGGNSLYEAKKHRHQNIHVFPSSIDKQHFAKARNMHTPPPEQANLTGPCVGFFGVIDERMDIDLLNAIAFKRPDWNLILIGPVVKIDPEILPRLTNIHYIGSKDYSVLPEYLSGWDVALIPFALNDSTEFISPTKTPEYLAGGVPVVSTAIRDVVNPYENKGLVCIGRGKDDFIKGIEDSLSLKKSSEWLQSVDDFLQNVSWDDTWTKMLYQLNEVLFHQKTHSKQQKSYV